MIPLPLNAIGMSNGKKSNKAYTCQKNNNYDYKNRLTPPGDDIVLHESEFRKKGYVITCNLLSKAGMMGK